MCTLVAMTEPSHTESGQPQQAGPQDSRKTEPEDSEPADLVDAYDDELLSSPGPTYKP